MTISIRHMQQDDITAVHTILGQQSVIDGTMRLPYAPIEYAQDRFKNSEDSVRLVAVADSEEVVGFLELITFLKYPRHNHCAEINFVAIREDWQNHGIGRQLMDAIIDLAEQWMQISRLSLIVWVDNKHAVHLYEKLGFEIEGTMPEYAYRNGRFIDAHMMGRVLSQQRGRSMHRERENEYARVW